MKYCLPQIPSIYWINKTRYRCKACGNTFDLYTPNGDDLVKFMESNGTEIRWLPMRGQGGYLELFEKFMPGFLASGEEIIPSITSKFMQKLQNHIELNDAGKAFELSYDRGQCLRCTKRELETLGEEILTSPAITWLEIDCELFSPAFPNESQRAG